MCSEMNLFRTCFKLLICMLSEHALQALMVELIFWSIMRVSNFYYNSHVTNLDWIILQVKVSSRKRALSRMSPWRLGQLVYSTSRKPQGWKKDSSSILLSVLSWQTMIFDRRLSADRPPACSFARLLCLPVIQSVTLRESIRLSLRLPPTKMWSCAVSIHCCNVPTYSDSTSAILVFLWV